MQSSLGNRLSNLLSLATGAAGVSWSGPEYRWIFEWVFYLSLLWAAVSIWREAWSNRAKLIGRLRKVEPSYIIILCLAVALGAALWQQFRNTKSPNATATQSTPAPDPAPPSKPEPEFVSNLQIGLSNVREKPVIVVGTTTATETRLRLFVEYSHPGGTIFSGLIPIGELLDVPRGTAISIPLINRDTLNGNELLFWGDPKDRRVVDTDGPRRPIVANIVIIGPDRTEQKKRFAFWYVDPNVVKEPFVFFTEENLQQFERQWVKQ
jgi:hypothetical protein